jgi:hypothetical protein
VVEIERLDEQGRVPDLPVPHEPVQLSGEGQRALLGLLLKGAETARLALSVDDLFHAGATERADELILEVGLAHVEPERFQLGAIDGRSDSAALECAPERVFLPGIAETGDLDAGLDVPEGVTERMSSSDCDNGDALGAEVAPAAFGQGLDGEPVAHPLHEYHGARRHAGIVL